jgi:hypothetical protein
MEHEGGGRPGEEVEQRRHRAQHADGGAAVLVQRQPNSTPTACSCASGDELPERSTVTSADTAPGRKVRTLLAGSSGRVAVEEEHTAQRAQDAGEQ